MKSIVAVIVGVTIAAVLSGCFGGGNNDRSATPTPAASLLPIDANLSTGTVTNVVDGITIDVDVSGEVFRVRYLGIALPDPASVNGNVQPLYQSIFEYNRFLVLGKQVEMEKGRFGAASDGAHYRYVYVGGQMVNEALLSGGYAVIADFPADFEYRSSFLEKVANAQLTNRGMWNPDNPVVVSRNPPPPAPSSSSTPIPVGTSTVFRGGTLPQAPGWRDQVPNCEYSDNQDPAIKGQVDAEGRRTYLIPGSTAYENAVVIESRGDRWFCTEADAKIAGFTGRS